MAVDHDEARELASFRQSDSVLFGAKNKRVLPVVVVTGFLGAGKTTLIQHLRRCRQNLRLAICVHEAAAVNIDSHTLCGDGALVDAPNTTGSPPPVTLDSVRTTGWVVPLSHMQHNHQACNCDMASYTEAYTSSVKSALRIFLQDGVDEGIVDYCLVECSGGEDPGWLCSVLEESFGGMYRVRLDSVICVVDCLTEMESLWAGRAARGPVELSEEAGASSPGAANAKTANNKTEEEGHNQRRLIAQSQLRNADLVVLSKLELAAEEVCVVATPEGASSIGISFGMGPPPSGAGVLPRASPREEDAADQQIDDIANAILQKLGWTGEYVAGGPMMRDVGIQRILHVESFGDAQQVLSHEQTTSLRVRGVHQTEAGTRRLGRRLRMDELPLEERMELEQAASSQNTLLQGLSTLDLANWKQPCDARGLASFLALVAALPTKCESKLYRGKAVLWVRAAEEKSSRRLEWNLSGTYRNDIIVTDWDAGIRPYSKLALIGRGLEDCGLPDPLLSMEQNGRENHDLLLQRGHDQCEDDYERLGRAGGDPLPPFVEEVIDGAWGAGVGRGMLREVRLVLKNLFPHTGCASDVEFLDLARKPPSFRQSLAEAVAGAYNRRPRAGGVVVPMGGRWRGGGAAGGAAGDAPEEDDDKSVTLVFLDGTVDWDVFAETIKTVAAFELRHVHFRSQLGGAVG